MYIHTLKEFNNVISTYDLCTIETEAIVYGRFRRFLQGGARDTWDQIIDNNPYQTTAAFKIQIDALMVEILGFSVVKYQK